MKDGASNASRTFRRSGIWALVTVAAVNALLLVCFHYTLPARQDPGAEFGEITLLDQATVRDAGFATWIGYHDPALFAMPDRRHGYSAWGGRPATHPEPGLPGGGALQASPTLPEAAVWLGVSEPVGNDWSRGLPAVSLEPAAPAAEIRAVYPAVLWQGRPVTGWKVPETLAAAAARAGAVESRATFQAAAVSGGATRCTALVPGGAGTLAWRKQLFLALADAAEAVSGGATGELTIVWRPDAEEAK